MIGIHAVLEVTSTVCVPDEQKLARMSAYQLRNHTITQVEWYPQSTYIFTFFDGQSCRGGKKYYTDYRTIFTPSKKITKVEVIIEKGEKWIDGINFYHQQEL